MNGWVITLANLDDLIKKYGKVYSFENTDKLRIAVSKLNNLKSELK